MKIVIDTNVFVSSFFWGGHPREVFERVINGFDELYITDEILKEIMSVMSSRKFDVNKNEIEDYIRIIEKYSKNIISKNIPESISRDKSDDKILQCGFDGNVDYIITGDKDLLVLKEHKTFKIINPKDYLEIV
jgi:putative PIN family toxin of toxin-antitoxin system